jgi:hypothetical protein
MQDNKVGPIAAMILGGLLLVAASFFGGSNQTTPEIVNNLKGTVLLVVHEKSRPPIDEVLALRRAPEFVRQYEFGSYLVVDQDDPNFAPVVRAVGNRNILPPFLAAGRMDDQRLVELVKAVEWKSGLEDILK